MSQSLGGIRGSKRRSREKPHSSSVSHKRATSSSPRLPRPPRPPARGAAPLPSRGILDVDAVRLEERPRGGADLGLPGLQGRRGRTRGGVYETSGLPALVTAKPHKASAPKSKQQATFV
ncbi:hypothetical protein COCON_G00109780 [Conger conger]|uniref:Uncharacterized protein n=1 Tax=Conger conger TaxID=82655 RepID=A0A9Q1DJE5_CONCO|nr:hypothetical protein COCON_G00109780 [Conger conger]